MPEKVLRRLATELERQAAEIERAARTVPAASAPAGRLLTVAQAGEYIGRSESAVRHLIEDREIPVVRVGRSVHIDRRDLDAWIENNKV